MYGADDIYQYLTATKHAPFTTAEYDLLPEGAPYQLLEGELVMTPAPRPFHQDVSRNIGFYLAHWLKQHKAGKVYYSPIDVELDKNNIVQPDLVVIKQEHLHIIGEKRIVGAPDLIIEILSPDNAYNDLKRKFELYERSGVDEYWIVDPELKTVEIYLNNAGSYELKCKKKHNGTVLSCTLNGFEMELDDIFSTE